MSFNFDYNYINSVEDLWNLVSSPPPTPAEPCTAYQPTYKDLTEQLSDDLLLFIEAANGVMSQLTPPPTPQPFQHVPDPQTFQPVPTPQPFQPVPSPQHFQPVPSPQPFQHVPDPQPFQPVPDPVSQRYPDPTIPAPPQPTVPIPAPSVRLVSSSRTARTKRKSSCLLAEAASCLTDDAAGPGDDGAAPPKKRQRKDRSLLTDGQKEQLESVYSVYKYVAFDVRQQIAADIGLSEKSVLYWFQNRRARDKRSK